MADNKLGLVGRKVGMTRIFTDDGETVPVTVVDVSNNRVTQVKTVETDGYTAIQVAYGSTKPSRVTKAVAGHYAKAGVEAGELLREFTVDAAKAGEFKAGATIGVDLFSAGQKVDVTGVTIGKGFAGAIKRHHFSSNRATHGNSVSTTRRARSAWPGPGPRVAGQAHGRPPWRRPAHDPEPGRGACRHRAPVAADPRRRPRCQGRQSHRPAGGQGLRG